MGGLTACMKLATEDALYVRQIRDALGGTNREAFESEAATVQSAMVHLAKCMASVPLSRFHGKSIIRRQPLFPHPPAFRYAPALRHPNACTVGPLESNEPLAVRCRTQRGDGQNSARRRRWRSLSKASRST